MKRWKSVYGLVAFWVACLTLTPNQASAYIDPSNTSFIIQALIGVGVAIAAGASIYWRKARKKIKKVIGNEETSGKDESDDI